MRIVASCATKNSLARARRGGIRGRHAAQCRFQPRAAEPRPLPMAWPGAYPRSLRRVPTRLSRIRQPERTSRLGSGPATGMAEDPRRGDSPIQARPCAPLLGSEGSGPTLINGMGYLGILGSTVPTCQFRQADVFQVCSAFVRASIKSCWHNQPSRHWTATI
jgi:hypothetical protein